MKAAEFCEEDSLIKGFEKDIYKRALFFDLEHYIYKKPVCIGVFGCCYYEEKDHELKITQYMIENQEDSDLILELAKDYFTDMIENKEKSYIVTFSGNNDFSVIRYLFDKYAIDFSIDEKFRHIDLQKQYEKEQKEGIGLKALEKIFQIERGSELISGSNLAKTFWKLVKDDSYIARIPKQKIEKILSYNEQDIVSLFQIYVNWNKLNYMYKPEIREKEETTGQAVE
ncbi:MAG: ribonuclease H-like domain-containing protein [Clostridiaceae bacterium]